MRLRLQSNEQTVKLSNLPVWNKHIKIVYKLTEVIIQKCGANVDTTAQIFIFVHHILKFLSDQYRSIVCFWKISVFLFILINPVICMLYFSHSWTSNEWFDFSIYRYNTCVFVFVLFVLFLIGLKENKKEKCGNFKMKCMGNLYTSFWVNT